MLFPIRLFIGIGVIALALGMTVPASAQLGMEWVARYSGPGEGDDVPRAMAVDDSGYVYVAGISHDGNYGISAPIIKYDAAGQVVWVDTRPNSYGNALTVEAGMYLHVTGSETVKYTLSGDTVWTRQADGVVNLVDDSGDVYITGDSQTIKFSAQGDTLWVVAFDQFSGGTSLTRNLDGFVYLSQQRVHFDFPIGCHVVEETTVKYAPSGDTVWIRTRDWNGPPVIECAPGASIRADAAGNVIVSSTDSSDFATIKYSGDGDTLWIRHYNGPADSLDRAVAMELDADGNACITGLSIGLDGTTDYATVKYSPEGNLQWVRQYNGSSGGWVDATDLAVDDLGNIYVTGSVSDDYFTIKYSSAGDTVWIRRFDGGLYEQATAIAVDDSGSVYVTGYSNNKLPQTTGIDFVTIKYSNPTGDINCDGFIDLVDVVLLGNLIDGLIDLTGSCGGGQADVDSDGDIDEDDFNLLYDVVAGVGP